MPCKAHEAHLVSAFDLLRHPAQQSVAIAVHLRRSAVIEQDQIVGTGTEDLQHAGDQCVGVPPETMVGLEAGVGRLFLRRDVHRVVLVAADRVQRIAARLEMVVVDLESGVQVDMRVLPPESWGAGLLYFTGSKSYNIRLRREAIKKGYKLSEYGLFDKRTGKMVAGRTEQEVCRKLGVKLPKPEDRER